MLINLRNALMAGKRLPYDAEVEYLRVDAVGPYIVIDGVTYCNAVGTYYAFTISSGGVVTHDLIPVRLGNTGYMYDRITNKRFGNAGTGDFVLGQDVVPVEYIESHGTQYINTGIRVDDTCGYNISFMGLDGNDRIIIGVKGAGDSRWVLSGVLATSVNLSWNTSSTYSGLGLRKIQEARMNYLNDRRRILNGVNVDNITSPLDAFANSYDVCLFAGYWGNANVSLYSAARIYFAQISKGQEIVRFFRSIRVGTEGAMMDVLTRRIYRNAGTGAFTYGNDLKYPIPAA